MKYQRLLLLITFYFFHNSTYSQTIWINVKIDSDILMKSYNIDSLEKKLLKNFIKVTNQELQKRYFYTYNFKIVDSLEQIPENVLSIQLSIKDQASHVDEIIMGQFVFSEKDEVVYKIGMTYGAKKYGIDFKEVLKTSDDTHKFGRILSLWHSMALQLDIFPKNKVWTYNIDDKGLDTLGINKKRFKNVLCILKTGKKTGKYNELFKSSIKNQLGKTQKEILELQSAYFNVYFIENKRQLKQYQEKYPQAIEIYCNLEYLGEEKYKASQQFTYYKNYTPTNTPKEEESFFEEDLEKYPIYSMGFFAFYDDLKYIFNLK